MPSNELAVVVNGLSKCFHIYERSEDRIKQCFYPKINRFLGLKEKVYYHEFWALKNINIEIKKGETVGIVGRNGSGKSTLLQLICGTLTPTSGEVILVGRVAALLELGSGFDPEFTGKENVYLNGTLLGLSKAEIDKKYNEILDFADIGEFINQPLKTYSSGMAIRLAFAVAINVEPDVLVVDEALSVGDELFQRKCFSKIEEIKNKGATILFVSHSGGTVVDLCDRAILIDAGEKLLVDDPKKIVAAYQKLLYAPLEKQSIIREQIKANDFLLSSDSVDGAPGDVVGSEVDSELMESFDAHLKPSSTIEYTSQGARITDARIELPGGKRINSLVSGREYEYVYNVSFSEAIRNVRFGMLIKTITGIELGGAVSAANAITAIKQAEKGASYLIKFKFKCLLNPGVYFLNAGVLGEINGVETYLHRSIDIAMFRVLPVENNVSTMVINFSPSVLVALES